MLLVEKTLASAFQSYASSEFSFNVRSTSNAAPVPYENFQPTTSKTFWFHPILVLDNFILSPTLA